MNPNDWQAMVDGLTPELVERLQSAVEIGKWPDGSLVSETQRASAMQALMLWQARHGEQDQHLTVAPGGELIQLSKSELKASFSGSDDGGDGSGGDIATLKPE